jgi:hypothetical protein
MDRLKNMEIVKKTDIPSTVVADMTMGEHNDV